MLPQALEGIRVLDLTQGVSGPYCTKLLGCFGAEVIKIEDPSQGDSSRRMGPFFQHLPDQETSATYLYLNTNKKSVTLNLNTHSGVETLKKLLPEIDVVVENSQPGIVASMGLGYPVIQAINPSIVMASVTYFGQDGPYRDYKGNSMIGFAVTGQMHQTGEPDREPLKSAGFQPEYTAGLHAYDAILAALYWRETSGKGQYIDVSAMEAMSYYHEFSIVTWTHVQTESIRAGNRYPVGGHPLNLIPCKDGYVSMSCVTPRQSDNLFVLIGMPDLAEDPKFATAPDRWDNYREFDELIEPWFMDHDMDEIVELAQELRIPCTYVPTFGKLQDDVQLSARDYWVAIEHPAVGTLPYAGAPFKMSQTPWRATRAPLLGEHNEEVYEGYLGLSREEMVRLRERNVI